MKEAKENKPNLGDMLDCKSMEQYLKDKAKNHNYYKVYGSEKKLRVVFEDNILYFSDGSGWNDTEDREKFQEGDPKYKYYARCFTYSWSENVAMWMLYAGRKDGIMVNIKKSQMNAIIESCKEIKLGNFSDDKFEEKETIYKGVEKDGEIIDGDFVLYLTDIVYFDKNKDDAKKYDVKRSYESYIAKKDDGTDRAFVTEMNRTAKRYPLSYENECRLILKVKKESLQNLKLSDAKIDFKNSLEKDDKEIGVRSSPNYSGKGEYVKSSLYDKINWNLCEGCKKSLCKECKEKIQ